MTLEDNKTVVPNDPPGIPRALLERAVRSQLGIAGLQLGDVHFTPVAEFRVTTGNTYLITGKARAAGDGPATESLPWSIVAKIIRKADPSTHLYALSLDASHPEYWPREAFAYAEKLTEGQPGLGAPRCFGVDTPTDDSHIIWLENVTDEQPGRWPLERYGRAAQHLGEFNGAYLSGERPLPQQPWLCTRFHYGRLERFPYTLDVFAGDELWRRPLVQKFMDGRTQARQRRMVADREALQQLLAGLPLTMAHNDPMRKQLRAVSRPGQPDSTVATNWGMVGVSPIGTDPASLFMWGMGSTEVYEHELRPLAQQVFDGYLQGLRSAGWQGDASTARAGFNAASALHALMWVPFILVTDEEKRESLGRKYETEPDTMAAAHVTALKILHEMADEVLSR